MFGDRRIKVKPINGHTTDEINQEMDTYPGVVGGENEGRVIKRYRDDEHLAYYDYID